MKASKYSGATSPKLHSCNMSDSKDTSPKLHTATHQTPSTFVPYTRAAHQTPNTCLWGITNTSTHQTPRTRLRYTRATHKTPNATPDVNRQKQQARWKKCWPDCVWNELCIQYIPRNRYSKDPHQMPANSRTLLYLVNNISGKKLDWQICATKKGCYSTWPTSLGTYFRPCLGTFHPF